MNREDWIIEIEKLCKPFCLLRPDIIITKFGKEEDRDFLKFVN